MELTHQPVTEKKSHPQRGGWSSGGGAARLWGMTDVVFGFDLGGGAPAVAHTRPAGRRRRVLRQAVGQYVQRFGRGQTESLLGYMLGQQGEL